MTLKLTEPNGSSGFLSNITTIRDSARINNYSL